MEVLFHDDNPIIEAKSSVEQFNKTLSAVRGGVSVPIEFDQIDYIDCDHVESHSIIVESDGDIDFYYPEGHLVASKEGKLIGDSGESRSFLFHDDDEQVELKSSVDQFNGWLATDKGGVEVPIESDRINYINCESINSDEIVISADDAGKFIYPEGHYVAAKEKVDGEGNDVRSILCHDDKTSVHVYSSIDQFQDYLADYRGGAWVPIEFDQIDYIDCDRVVSHPVIIDNGDNIGYYFTDGHYSFVTDEYPTFDYERTELRELPEYMGSGFYEAYDKGQEIVNDDNGNALGIRNENKLRIGQHYYLADEILPSSDFE